MSPDVAGILVAAASRVPGAPDDLPALCRHDNERVDEANRAWATASFGGHMSVPVPCAHRHALYLEGVSVLLQVRGQVES